MNSSNVDVNSLSEQIQAEVQMKQFRDFLVEYNKLSENCFAACVWDFTSRQVKNQELSCVKNCAEKYTKVTQRISERFQELQLLTSENAAHAAQKLSKLSS
ncbi:UNVERIFIED_CONTAM: hypothetical protein RMT77_016342 [Armadillidium vulgare]